MPGKRLFHVAINSTDLDRSLAFYERLGFQTLSLHEALKRAILDSDGHDTLITEITDVAAGVVWPGAYARVRRNRLVEDWIGREGELRRHRDEVRERIERARREGDVEHAVVYTGQTAGLIDSVQPAARVVEEIVGEAAGIIRSRLAPALGADAG
jgi:NAD(P)H-dependent flavin oxidoreductase YrpB (nitropropane dioxygenase family)